MAWYIWQPTRNATGLESVLATRAVASSKLSLVRELEIPGQLQAVVGSSTVIDTLQQFSDSIFFLRNSFWIMRRVNAKTRANSIKVQMVQPFIVHPARMLKQIICLLSKNNL